MKKLLDNMTVRVSWSLVLAVFAVLILVLSGLGLYTVRYSEDSLRTLNQVNVDQQSTLNRANSEMLFAQNEMRNLHARLAEAVWPEEREEVQAEAAALDETLDQVEATFEEFLALPRQPGQETLIAPIEESFAALMNQGLRPQREALVEGSAEAFNELTPAVERLTRAFYDHEVSFFSAAEQKGASLYTDFFEQVGLLKALMIAALIIAALTIIGVLWGVTVNVIRPLGRLVGYFERMEQGDLSEEIPQRGNNEIGRLYSSLAQMQRGLAETVGSVRVSSDSIYQGAQSIASGNNDLSSRTEEQAASLQETASSMEELSSTVGQNAENAQQASQLAAEATRTAREGGEVVGEVVSTMHEISQGSHRVAEIIGTIDSIAFQTNILALNASVEAARAGEHGRGFAVVAEEVRNLATRSADAASEIRGLIEASVSQVETGSSRVDRAGKTMQEIVNSVQRVSDIMDEIAAASTEQSNGISQVNDAVTQMDQVTQQNATLVQQAASAATQLESEAGRLREVTSRFRLKEGEQAPRLAPRTDSDGDLARWMPSLVADQGTSSSASRAPQAASRSADSHPAEDDWESF
ncbi:methyl-accepting chemotaxis protein [Halomonas koreensis]|uniref:Methyl-accepting chemotaxis protein n=1 Tax=Halomonas koreensis TaxID=245385 RepID=A0ABU1G1T2_9GAMM|nr:methyl-accepting chemotaxis protein [Halomonas koreensis]MDR5866905.1 methyl-accepting chemotaxis protein [Halomonas koreensis]